MPKIHTFEVEIQPIDSHIDSYESRVLAKIIVKSHSAPDECHTQWMNIIHVFFEVSPIVDLRFESIFLYEDFWCQACGYIIRSMVVTLAFQKDTI
eukprot:UN23123